MFILFQSIPSRLQSSVCDTDYLPLCFVMLVFQCTWGKKGGGTPSHLILPVQSNGREAEDSHRAEDLVQKFDDLAEEHGVDPPATVRTGAKDDVKRHTHQAGTNPRAGQVFNEPVGDRFEHGCAAS